MEIRVLKYFLAVAREENITAAAETLHVTQPTLSKQLMDLEAELGKKLFERGNRRITLTEDGILLRKRAREIVDLMEKTEAELRDTEDDISGEVFIGGGETEAIRFVAKAMKACQGQYPHLRFNLFSGNADAVIERLDRGLIDFALLIEPVDVKKYKYLRLPYEDVWGVLMPKTAPLAKKESVTPEDVTDIPVFCSSRAGGNSIEGWMGTEAERLNAVIRFNLIYNAAIMVQEGIGYAFCIDRLADVSTGSQLVFRPLSPFLKSGVVFAWKRDQALSKGARVLLEHLQELVKTCDTAVSGHTV
jgi:DNA-binding transcriptional LysR family regulator